MLLPLKELVVLDGSEILRRKGVHSESVLLLVHQEVSDVFHPLFVLNIERLDLVVFGSRVI